MFPRRDSGGVRSHVSLDAAAADDDPVATVSVNPGNTSNGADGTRRTSPATWTELAKTSSRAPSASTTPLLSPSPTKQHSSTPIPSGSSATDAASVSVSAVSHAHANAAPVPGGQHALNTQQQQQQEWRGDGLTVAFRHDGHTASASHSHVAPDPLQYAPPTSSLPLQSSFAPYVPAMDTSSPQAGHECQSTLRRFTVELLATYQRCNPQIAYSVRDNPRRVLTKPSVGVKNDGFDNEESDYILYVNDILGEKEGSRFVILDVLGSGTFGQVVKCRNLKTNEIAAIKVIKNKPAYFNQSMMEVTILELLNSRYDSQDQHHIARMLEVFVFRKHLCLVFELLSVNLYELIKQNHFRGLNSGLVRMFTTQILEALTVLSEARLIHCDLKPENILLKNLESPAIKIIDFGSACHEQQTVYTYIQSRFYRSPEVLLGLPYSSSIDMWSVGCIVVELFLGLPIFPGSSEYNQICRIVETLGLPPAYMLEFGKNSRKYFDRTVDADGKSVWYLKSLQQYNSERSLSEQPSKRYFHTHNLKELILNYPMSSRKSAIPAEVEKELASRQALLDFVGGLLNLNPLERWSPQQARMHPFITGAPFHSPFTPPMEFKPRRRMPSTRRSREQLAVHQQPAGGPVKHMDSAGSSVASMDTAAHRRPRASTISSAKLAAIPSQLQQAAAANSAMKLTKYPSQSSRKPSISSFAGPPSFSADQQDASGAAAEPGSQSPMSSRLASRQEGANLPLRASPLLDYRITNELDHMSILHQQQQQQQQQLQSQQQQQQLNQLHQRQHSGTQSSSSVGRFHVPGERTAPAFQPERQLLPAGAHLQHAFQRKIRSHSVSDRGASHELWLNTMGYRPSASNAAASAPVSPLAPLSQQDSGLSSVPAGVAPTSHMSQSMSSHQEQLQPPPPLAHAQINMQGSGNYAPPSHQQSFGAPQPPQLFAGGLLPRQERGGNHLADRHALSLSALSQIREDGAPVLPHPDPTIWGVNTSPVVVGGNINTNRSPPAAAGHHLHSRPPWPHHSQQQQHRQHHQLGRRLSAPSLNAAATHDLNPHHLAAGAYSHHYRSPPNHAPAFLAAPGYTAAPAAPPMPSRDYWPPAPTRVSPPLGLSPPHTGFRPANPSALSHSFVPPITPMEQQQQQQQQQLQLQLQQQQLLAQRLREQQQLEQSRHYDGSNDGGRHNRGAD